mmetsp:Transcript_14309/g.31370  ORF Transcript_14309/g.31370 Transcript_14309/m.31370 type:complete len:628 (+) Transcript_14309:241-2124(+)
MKKKSQPTTAHARRRSGAGDVPPKKGSNAAGMRMRLSSAGAYDPGTVDSSRDSTPTPTTPTGRARTGRRANQRQKKPTPAPAGKKPTLVTVAEKKPADSKSSQDNKKKSRSRGRETEERQSSFEHETSYTESYSSGSEDESVGNSTYESEDNTTGASFDSNTRRRLAKSARRHAAARRRRNGCATPPPRPKPKPVTSPVRAAKRMIEKIDDMISPQSSEADESNPSTESLVHNRVIDFVVQNEVNQLKIQNIVHGNVERLHLHEMSYIPTPKTPTDVIVKVERSNITLQDCMVRRGKWHEKQSLPYIPGTDVVGTILALGKNALKFSSFKAGDYVYAIVPSGGNAKYASIPYQDLIRVPEGTDPTVALCLASIYTPVRQSLDLARKANTPLTGANVLVIGGNGPMGLATIDLALHENAIVHATASERHHPYLTSLGVRCLPIDPAKWRSKLKGRMDVVFDSVCIDDYASSHMALNSTGTLICTGFSAVYTRGKIPFLNGYLDMRDFRARLVRFHADWVLDNTVFFDRRERYLAAPNEFAQHFRFLCHLHKQGIITPTVSGCTPLKMVPVVQRNIERGDVPYGVCVCMPWDTGVTMPPSKLVTARERVNRIKTTLKPKALHVETASTF